MFSTRQSFPISGFVKTLLFLAGIGVLALAGALGFGAMFLIDHVRFR